MEVQAATAEQIATFKKAAALRYKERGIEPKVASRLFDAQMSKLGMELGMIQQPVSPKIDKIASDLAKELGVERKSAKK